jgi:hypothetical protein
MARRRDGLEAKRADVERLTVDDATVWVGQSGSRRVDVLRACRRRQFKGP